MLVAPSTADESVEHETLAERLVDCKNQVARVVVLVIVDKAERAGERLVGVREVPAPKLLIDVEAIDVRAGLGRKVHARHEAEVRRDRADQTVTGIEDWVLVSEPVRIVV